tara:strand:- start:433 stop:1449 length:1017 start_codon:yes stop_codon:yes gene_type:complete
MRTFAQKKMKIRSALEDQIKILHHSPKVFAEAIIRLLRAQLRGDMYAEEVETKRLANLIGENNVLANLMGRRRMFLEWKAYTKENPVQPFRKAFLFNVGDEFGRELNDDITPVVPQVPYDQALKDLFSRPVYGEKLELGWEAVHRMYTGDHAFALARTTSESISRRVQDYIGKAMREGKNQETAKRGMLTAFGEEMVENLGNYANAYASTVFKTNSNTSFNEGRMQEAQDPVIAEVIGGFMFDTFLDDEVRANHKAAHGFIAGTNDSIWRKLQPPLGYNCRCTIDFVDKFEMERWGLIRPSGEVQRGWYNPTSQTASTVIPASFAMAGPDIYRGVSFK